MSTLDNYLTKLMKQKGDLSAGEYKNKSIFSLIKAFVGLQNIINNTEETNDTIKIINNSGIIGLNIQSGSNTSNVEKPLLKEIQNILGIKDGLRIKINNDNLITKNVDIKNPITDIQDINLISGVGFENIDFAKNYLKLLMNKNGYMNNPLMNLKQNMETNNMVILDEVIKDKRNGIISKKNLKTSLNNKGIYFLNNNDITYFPKLDTINRKDKTIIAEVDNKTAPNILYFVIFNANSDVIIENNNKLIESFDSSLNTLNATSLNSLFVMYL